MLQAVLENGTKISMADKWYEKELLDLRKKQRFKCPICHTEVILKIGMKRQWHFAHYQNQSCRISLEAESPYHLQGKLDLYRWLLRQGVKTGLEVYLPVIQQRPDILCKVEGKLYAIEYQCSSLSEESLYQRTNGYLSIGITPIWILGGNRLRRKPHHTFQLNGFEWVAADLSQSNQNHLIYYCSESKEWAFLTNVAGYSSTRALANLSTTTKNTSFTIDELIGFKRVFAFNMDAWLQIKKKWRMQPLNPYYSKSHHQFSKTLYLQKIVPGLFPAEAGWYLSSQHHLRTSPHIWQSLLLVNSILPKQIYDPIYVHDLEQTVVSLLLNGLITWRGHSSLSQHELASELAYEYAELLATFQILKKENRSQYTYIQKLTTPASFAEAMQSDSILSKIKQNTPNLPAIQR